MKGMLRHKLWLALLTAVIMFGLFNLKAIADFFVDSRDPNERVTRTLEWKTATAEERRAVFSIPRGYYVPGDHNKEGEVISLRVMYPSKAFVPWASDKGPEPNAVNIRIDAGNSRGPVQTRGDRFKAALDNGTLLTSTHQEFVGKQGELIVLRMTGNDEFKEVSYLFHDSARGHWVSSRPMQGQTFRAAEAVLNDQTAYVSYWYRQSVESNPVTMHGWVVEFVESLQTTKQQTQTQEK